MIGQTIAHYRITEKLGQGGMGEVYRASDTKLKRDVALKILPESFSADSQRMARFQREAELLASLNHPNIAAVYGLEMEGPIRAIAMELVEGETLAARIQRGAIPLEEALQIALQIATAFEAAHEKGIIHRDLKPANVILTPGGAAKVLDFGLAKALDGETPELDVSQSPTLSMQATRAGIILGTAAYMSPEQAKGLPADRRADVWSFGVVLWEMLTGKQAFQAGTMAETMAAVMLREPDFEVLPAALPRRIRRLLERCLTKDVRRRLQAIGEARIAIEQTLAGDQEATEVSAPAPVSRRATLPWIGLAVALLIALVASVLLKSPPVPLEVVGFEVETGDLSLSRGMHRGSYFALSPDGQRIALLLHGEDSVVQIYLRRIDSEELQLLPGTEGAAFPTFSPDGQWIAFAADGAIKKIPVAGGLPIELVNQAGPMAWTRGTIIYVNRGGALYQIPEGGGTASLLYDESEVRWLHAVRGTQRLLVTIVEGENFSIGTLTLSDPKVSILAQEGSWAQYAGGYLIYAQRTMLRGQQGFSGGLLALAFDPESGETSRSPIPVLDGVDVGSGGAAHFLISADGDLLYRPGGGEDQSGSLLLRIQPEAAIDLVTKDSQRWDPISVSADGSRISYLADDGIYLFDPLRGVSTRLTYEGVNDDPVISPDGQRVAFQSGTDSIWIQEANPAAKPRLLIQRVGEVIWPTSWSSDGRFLVFGTRSKADLGDIWLVPLNEWDGEARPLVATPLGDRDGQVSPGGNWLAYSSLDSEKKGIDVFIQPFPEPGPPIKVTPRGGRLPRWSGDGRKLFFYDDDRIFAVDTDLQGQAKVGVPAPVTPSFESLDLSGTVLNTRILDYQGLKDGSLLVSVPNTKGSSGGGTGGVHVILNFLQELKEKMGAPE